MNSITSTGFSLKRIFSALLLVALICASNAVWYVAGKKQPKPEHPFKVMAGTIVHYTELGTWFRIHGYPEEARILVVDRIFFAPDTSELVELLAAYKPPRPYRSESWDCDNYAQDFKARLGQMWAEQGHDAPLLIGVVYGLVEIDGKQVAHAFNVIITAQGRMIQIEPQGAVAVRYKVLQLWGMEF